MYETRDVEAKKDRRRIPKNKVPNMFGREES